ncbi:hypothetical protein AB0283_00675 [Micromonospora vinacea]|uniref:hypothetical protein n=1 Tax=Micromonospora vinacea TaxID=709878 RepID=UPI00344F67C5
MRDQNWPQWWSGLEPFGRGATPIIRYLLDQGYLGSDSDMLYIGPEAERRFGHRHFMGMTAVFVGAPEFTVLVGRDELGRVDPALLTEEVQGDVDCYSTGEVGGSPTSTGGAGAASSNPPRAAERLAGQPGAGQASDSS